MTCRQEPKLQLSVAVIARTVLCRQTDLQPKTNLPFQNGKMRGIRIQAPNRCLTALSVTNSPRPESRTPTAGGAPCAGQQP